MISTELKQLCCLSCSGPYFKFLPVLSTIKSVVMSLLFFLFYFILFFILGSSELSGQFSEQLSDGGFTSPKGLMVLVFLLV